MKRVTRTFTKRERSTFEQICKLKQNGVLTMMRQLLVRRYGRENVIINPAYIIATGEIPVALVAHADTVFKVPPSLFFYDQEANVMWSPDGMGADDRAGIFSMVKIISSGLKPHIIITTDEESGCIGANKLVTKYSDHPFDELKFIIQLDRRGTEDSVYYDCANPEFEKFINAFGFKTAQGSFSDISVLAPVWGIAAVNFSIGYQDEHSYQERLHVGEMFNTIDKVCNILTHVRDNECANYEYIEDLYIGRYGYPYEDSWWDDGYSLKPYNIKATDKEMCCFCGNMYKKEDMLYLHYDESTPFYLCNACYSVNYQEVEWCSHCREGWFLTKVEAEELKANGDNRMHWLCRNCREDNKSNVSGNSKASESGSISVSACAVSADRQADGAVGECKEENDYGYEWSGL